MHVEVGERHAVVAPLRGGHVDGAFGRAAPALDVRLSRDEPFDLHVPGQRAGEVFGRPVAHPHREIEAVVFAVGAGPGRAVEPQLAAAALEHERVGTHLGRGEGAHPLRPPPSHAQVAHVLAAEAALEDRVRHRAEPAPVENARAGEPDLLRVCDRGATAGRAEGMAHPHQEVVGRGQVAALRVQREIGAVVAPDAALQARFRRRRAQLGALHELHAVHRPPFDTSRQRRAAVGARGEVEGEGARQIPDPPARPFERQRAARRCAQPRGADVEHEPAEPFGIHPPDLAGETGDTGGGRHVDVESGGAPEGLDLEAAQTHPALVPQDLTPVARDRRAAEAASRPLEPAADAEARAFDEHHAVVVRLAAHPEAGPHHVPLQHGEIDGALDEELAPQRRDLDRAPIGEVGAFGLQPAGGDGEPRALHGQIHRGRQRQRRVVAEADVTGTEGHPARERAAGALPELALEAGQVQVQGDPLVIDEHLAPADHEPADAHLHPGGPVSGAEVRQVVPAFAEGVDADRWALDFQHAEEQAAVPQWPQGRGGEDPRHLEEGRRRRARARDPNVADLGREREEAVPHRADARRAPEERREAPGHELRGPQGQAEDRRRHHGHERHGQDQRGPAAAAQGDPSQNRRLTPRPRAGIPSRRSGARARGPRPRGPRAGKAARSPSSWPP